MTTQSKVTIKADNVEISSGLLRTAYIIDTEGSKYYRPRDFRSKIKSKILEAEPSVYNPDDYWDHVRSR